MATLSLPVEFPFQERLSYELLSSGRLSGRAFRRPRNYRRQREFELTFFNLIECEFEQIVALVKGSAGTFQITPPDEVTPINVQFSEDTIGFTRKNALFYEVSLRVRESFG